LASSEDIAARRWRAIVSRLAGQLIDARCLVVGAKPAYGASALRLAGAGEVVACDTDPAHVGGSEPPEKLETGVVRIPEDAFGVHPQVHGRFDLVVCDGVMNRTPHPLALLERVAGVLNQRGSVLIGVDLLRRARAATKLLGSDPWDWRFGETVVDRLLSEAGLYITDAFGARRDVRHYFLATATGHHRSQLDPPVPVRFPPGHYYSPQPDTRDLASELRRSQVRRQRPAIGIDWNEPRQRELLDDLAHQRRLAFPAEPGRTDEYYYNNGYFERLDAWLLEGLLRRFRPRRLVEVGAGFSTLLSARVNRECLGGAMQLVVIEPFPQGFLTEEIDGITEIRMEKVQDTPLEVFATLARNDVLFIDTSHTVKTGGDATWLHNEIVPRLAPGVIVHIHDIFLPRDYPESWVLEGWGWNEQYLVQAFLAFNSAFEILLSASWAGTFEPELLRTACPGWRGEEEEGGSLWIRRLSGR
jgi:hypothetical protein